jgi:putative intracellular protease/amidase
MAAPRRALIVSTAAATFRGSDAPAGCYAEELATPYNAWTAAGLDVDIATPRGDAIAWSACTRARRARSGARAGGKHARRAAAVGACVM